MTRLMLLSFLVSAILATAAAFVLPTSPFASSSLSSAGRVGAVSAQRTSATAALAGAKAPQCTRCGPLSMSSVDLGGGDDEEDEMMDFQRNPANIQVGDTVKVLGDNVLMWHIKDHREEGLVVSGMVGKVKMIKLKSRKGGSVTANRPVVVTFTDPKFLAHFEFGELEIVERAPEED